MANLGMADSLIIMVIALVAFGPRKLPQIGRQIGKLMYEFRKASNDFKFQMEEELRNAEDADRRKADEERMRALSVTATAPKLTAPEPVTTAIIGEAAPSAATESPYPNEGVYPPVIPAYAEASAEETVPRIQPPSTGERVEAERPNRSTALAQAGNHEAAQQDAAAGAETGLNASEEPGAAIANPVTLEPGALEEQPASEAEQAAHHA